MSDTTLDIPEPDENADTYTALEEVVVTAKPISWATIGIVGFLMIYSLFGDDM